MKLLFLLLLSLLAVGQEKTSHWELTGRTVVSDGSKQIVICEPTKPETFKGCKLADGITLAEAVSTVQKILDQENNELRQMVRYDQVCSKWGKWHYRKSSSTQDGHGGISFSPPDRYRVCIAPKPIYQEQMIPEEVKP